MPDPITYTFLNESTQLQGSYPLTSSSFTPTAGQRLLVASYVQPDSTGSPPALSISDSQGLSWTELENVGTPGGYSWAFGIYLWASEPCAAVSTTIFVNVAGSPTTWVAGMIIGEIPDVPLMVAGATKSSNTTTNGGYTKTLTEIPTTNDLVIFVRGMDNDAGATTISMAGWETHDTTGITQATLGMGTNNISSSSVVVTDTNTTDRSPVYAIDLAFFLREGEVSVVYGSYFWDF